MDVLYLVGWKTKPTIGVKWDDLDGMGWNGMKRSFKFCL